MIELFKFKGKNVRFAMIDNDVWFVAMDVAYILDYADNDKMLNLVDEEDKQVKNPHKLETPRLAETFSSNTFRVSFINESGLYACIFGSTKPEAKAFKKWVTSELLPQIRKTGSYSIESKPKTAIELARENLKIMESQIKLLEEIEIQKSIIESQEKDLEKQSEIIDELYNYSSIIRVAKYNKCSETKFNWRRLKSVSESMGLEIKVAPCPRYTTKNLYSHDAWRVAYPEYALPETTTLVIS